MITALVYSPPETIAASEASELVRMARSLTGDDGRVEELVVTADAHAHPAGHGSDVLLRMTDRLFTPYIPEAHALALIEAIRVRSPQVVILQSGVVARDIASFVAGVLDWYIVSNCIEVAMPQPGALATKSEAYDGRVVVSAHTPLPAIVVVESLRHGEVGERSSAPSIVDMPSPPGLDVLKMKLVGTRETDRAGGPTLERAERIVCVGRGIGSRDNMPKAADLAASLGAELAGSRPVVDAGWLPKSRQIGVSGCIVSPRVYLALGVSGAFQHLTGIRGAKVVIAVNKDHEAPIFEVADYGATCDILELIPVLSQRARLAQRT